MNSKRFFVGFFLLLISATAGETSPISRNVVPDSEQLGKHGIAVECRADSFRDGQPLSFAFRIRVSNQEPIPGKPSFFGFFAVSDNAGERGNSFVAVHYRGDAEEGFEANFRVDAKKLDSVRFSLSWLIEHVQLDLDLKAFAEAALEERRKRKR